MCEGLQCYLATAGGLIIVNNRSLVDASNAGKKYEGIVNSKVGAFLPFNSSTPKKRKKGRVMLQNVNE